MCAGRRRCCQQCGWVAGMYRSFFSSLFIFVVCGRAECVVWCKTKIEQIFHLWNSQSVIWRAMANVPLQTIEGKKHIQNVKCKIHLWSYDIVWASENVPCRRQRQWRKKKIIRNWKTDRRQIIIVITINSTLFSLPLALSRTLQAILLKH